MRAFTVIPLGLSDFGRPVRGLKYSPSFCATITSIIHVTQKVKYHFAGRGKMVLGVFLHLTTF